MYESFVRTVNPATEEEIAHYRLASFEDASAKLKTANIAFEKWKNLSIDERNDYLRRLAKSLRTHTADAAKTITEEMGKPISQSEAEVEKCAWAAEVYADNAKQWLSRETVRTDAHESRVEFQPLGIIFSVMPWNFPFWQTCRSVIPTLTVGNVAVLRHSNQVPGCSLKLDEIFQDAGFPEGVFGTIITDHSVVEKMIESRLVRGVSFSGSIDSGKTIGEAAGRNLKKAVLELGGSDPFIVLEDADIGEAARIGANARLVCNGQSCIAAKRFIVVREVAKEFVEALTQEFSQRTIGDPMDHEVDVGPLRSEHQMALLEDQMNDAVRNGAISRIGGKRREGKGFFYEPTVLEEVTPEMKIMREEVFGPVAPIYVAEDVESAVRVSNDTDFGLGASIWTSDPNVGRELALRMECGVVFVNELVKSDPRMPFGGIKQSGIGRELSRFGLLEFVNAKSINLYS